MLIFKQNKSKTLFHSIKICLFILYFDTLFDGNVHIFDFEGRPNLGVFLS